MRYAINKSEVNYWPNRFNHIPPNPEAKGALINFEQKVAGIKQRLNAPKFKEYYNQAQLFLNSLAPHEYEHLVGALTFELSKCDDEIVTHNMIKRLNDIDFELAKVCSLYSDLLILDCRLECWGPCTCETSPSKPREERQDAFADSIHP
jgi:catalase